MMHRNETCLVKISPDETSLHKLFSLCGRKVVRVCRELKWLEISTSKHDGLVELGISFAKDLNEEHEKEFLIYGKTE